MIMWGNMKICRNRSFVRKNIPKWLLSISFVWNKWCVRTLNFSIHQIWSLSLRKQPSRGGFCCYKLLGIFIPVFLVYQKLRRHLSSKNESMRAQASNAACCRGLMLKFVKQSLLLVRNRNDVHSVQLRGARLPQAKATVIIYRQHRCAMSYERFICIED